MSNIIVTVERKSEPKYPTYIDKIKLGDVAEGLDGKLYSRSGVQFINLSNLGSGVIASQPCRVLPPGTKIEIDVETGAKIISEPRTQRTDGVDVSLIEADTFYVTKDGKHVYWRNDYHPDVINCLTDSGLGYSGITVLANLKKDIIVYPILPGSTLSLTFSEDEPPPSSC